MPVFDSIMHVSVCYTVRYDVGYRNLARSSTKTWGISQFNESGL